MAQEQTAGNAVGWRVLVLVGALGNAVGLIGKVPLVTLAAAPIMIIGVIGLLTTRHRQRQQS